MATVDVDSLTGVDYVTAGVNSLMLPQQNDTEKSNVSFYDDVLWSYLNFTNLLISVWLILSRVKPTFFFSVSRLQFNAILVDSGNMCERCILGGLNAGLHGFLIASAYPFIYLDIYIFAGSKK